MSQVYGPYGASSTPPLAVGTVTQIPVTQKAGAITISNQSIFYDMLIDFGVSQPPVVTQAGGQSWSHVLHPGDVLDVPLLNPDLTPTPQGLFWGGFVWVLPLSNAALLSLTGQMPTITNFWVTIYAPGEPVPQRATSSPTVSQVGQQRTVAVPVAGIQLWQGNAAASVATLATYNLNGLFGGVMPSNLFAAKQATTYLYWFRAWLSGWSAGTNFARCVLEVFPSTGGGTVLTGFTPLVIHTFEMNAVVGAVTSGNTAGFNYDNHYPPNPAAVFLNWNGLGSATSLYIRLRCLAFAGTMNIYWEGNPDVDYANDDFQPGTIGNGTRDGVSGNTALFTASY